MLGFLESQTLERVEQSPLFDFSQQSIVMLFQNQRGNTIIELLLALF